MILTIGSMYDKNVRSCLWTISQDAFTTSFKGRAVSSDFAARKSAAVAINCKTNISANLFFCSVDGKQAMKRYKEHKPSSTNKKNPFG